MFDLNDWMQRWNSALREQHDLLFDDAIKGLKSEYAEIISCPICGSTKAKLWFEKDWFYYWRCNKCSMVYMNPRMNLAATHSFYNSNVNKIYNETKFDKTSPSTEMDDQINYGNLKLLKQISGKENGMLLEIGSAKGFFLIKAKEAGFDVYGLELNQPNYEYSRNILGDCIMDVDLFDVKFEDNKFDVVYMRDVIEHIANPLEFLKEINRITKPGGVIFLETHNIDSWINRSARENHTVIFGFEHPNHWSPKTLSLALQKTGYQVINVTHTSLDCTLAEMRRYMLQPGFTTIYPKPPARSRLIMAKIIARLYGFSIMSKVDRIMPRLANQFKAGSTMKVIARKNINQ